MKRILLIFAVLLICMSVTADDIIPFYNDCEGVAVINKRDYVPNVIQLFDNAEKTIHAVIYQTRYYEGYPDGTNRQMYKAMFRAVERGVEVSVIADQSSWNTSSTLKNEEFGKFMEENGVNVFYEPADKTTHSKIIIVDSLYTVVGSTNWSFYALEKNDESAVIVKSALLASDYEDFFYNLLEFSTEELTILQ